MCFSATASFVAAAVTGGIGAVAVTRVQSRRELPLAAAPLVFALQQTVEGLLWLNLHAGHGAPSSTPLPLLFLLIAEAVWPVYMPIAAMLMEPSGRRRSAMAALALAGAGLAAYLLWGLLTRTHGAVMDGGHIVYQAGQVHPITVGLIYVCVATLPLLISSHRALNVLGGVLLTGFVIAYLFYVQAFLSVWCFFAAAASVLILLHFERARMKAPALPL